MSEEIFQIVRMMDKKKTEAQIVLQCAPVITGLKVSNLLIVDGNRHKEISTLLNNTWIFAEMIYQSEKRGIYLLYRKELTDAFLKSTEVINLLKEMGYADTSFEKIIEVIRVKYGRYLEKGGAFPHEMGILLGYPLEDVIGFMENEGRNSLYSGYWKVYDNVAEKLNLFKKFDVAKEMLILLYSNGVRVNDIIDIYEKDLKAAV